MKKRILSMILAAVLVFGLCIPAAAAYTRTVDITYRAIRVVINGKEITPCDAAGRTVEPFIMDSNGTTYLPLRAVAQALGLSVGWNNETSTVILSRNGSVKTGEGEPGTTRWNGSVDVTYRDIKIVLDGVQLDPVNAQGEKVEPFILNSNDSTYMPLRAIAQALGLSVSWDNETSTASLSGTLEGVAGLRLSATDVRGSVGDYFRLEAYSGSEQEASDTVKWSSTDAKVAGVNSKGIVVLQGVGSADIIATDSDGSSARCHVTVRGSGDSDPYNEKLGYSLSEIEKLADYGSQAAESVAKGLEACEKAEEAQLMGPLHVNTAVSRVCEAATQLEKAAAYMSNGKSLRLESGDYATVLAIAKAAISKLSPGAELKADSQNADEVLEQVEECLVQAQEIIALYVEAMEKIAAEFTAE